MFYKVKRAVVVQEMLCTVIGQLVRTFYSNWRHVLLTARTTGIGWWYPSQAAIALTEAVF